MKLEKREEKNRVSYKIIYYLKLKLSKLHKIIF